MADAFELSYAGVGFSLDAATVVRADQTPRTKGTNSYAVDGGADVRNHQPIADFIDELDRIMPFRYIHDFDYPSPSPRIDSLALKDIDDAQDVKARIGEFYYPSTAAKWSVFRGLATSTQLKRMMVATNNGASAASFVIQSKPMGATGTTNYRVSTPMRILAPRCVGETIGTVDGLYLITLVDERFYFQGTGVSLNLTSGESWASVVARIAAVLGITVSFPDLPAVYERPEADSQLWTFRENAALMLDAVANNLGCVVVRDLSGNYGLMRHETSAATAVLNRTGIKARTAGGNLYTPGGMPVGSLKGSRNGVCPATVNVTFPKYVTGDDPVPHFLNPRYGESRPSARYETSLAETHVVPVPIQSGGIYVSGLTGVGDDTVHVAGKAYLDTEASVLPSNGSGLTALAMRVAQDRYTFLASVAFDETYPGTVKLLPEGIHDIVWTYSARRRQATTRMVRGPWTMLPDTLQHAAPALSGRGYNPKGVGGPSVAQSHTGKAYPSANVASGGGTFASGVSPVTVSLAAGLASGAVTVSLGRVDYLPTDYRWKGTVNGEAILFEGTSGGTSSGTASTVGVVQRAVDGTLPASHASGSTVTMTPAQAVYGVNLVEHGRMQFVHPGQWRSGGIQGAVAAPQVQTVRVMSASGVVLNGVTHYSGQVLSYNPTKTSGLQFPVEGNAWIVERSQLPVTSGYRYGGQLLGYSKSDVSTSGSFSGRVIRPAAPVYGIDERISSGGAVSSGGITYPWATPTDVGLVNFAGQRFGGPKNFYDGNVSFGPTGVVASGVSAEPVGLTGLRISAVSGILSGSPNVTMELYISGAPPVTGFGTPAGIRIDYITGDNSINVRSLSHNSYYSDAFHMRRAGGSGQRSYLRFGNVGIVQRTVGSTLNTTFGTTFGGAVSGGNVENPAWAFGVGDEDEWGGARFDRGIFMERGHGLRPVGAWGTDAAGNTVVDGRITDFASGVAYAAPTFTTSLLPSPSSGPTAGGTRVAFYGTGFRVGASVTVGGASAPYVLADTSRRVIIDTPAGSSGIQAVVITNPDGQTATLSPPLFGFTYG